MKKTILLLGVLLTSYSFAQVSINKDAAHTPKATLDVEAMTTTGDTVEGILIPRVTREKAAAMRNVVESTMIYVDNVTTGAASGTTADVDTKGFYYYNGTKWVKVGGGDNIYSADGTLAANRTVTQNNNDFTFKTGTAKAIIDGAFQHKGAVYVDNGTTTSNIRVYNGITSPASTITANDYMLILTNVGLHGNLTLPSAAANKGRIIYYVNGITQGIGFSGSNLDGTSDIYPFNYTMVPNRGSIGFISTGTTWYPLGR